MGIKITKYKVVKWFKRKQKSFIYGIDVMINKKWHHFTDTGKPLFFALKKDALTKKKQLILPKLPCKVR